MFWAIVEMMFSTRLIFTRTTMDQYKTWIVNGRQSFPITHQTLLSGEESSLKPQYYLAATLSSSKVATIILAPWILNKPLCITPKRTPFKQDQTTLTQTMAVTDKCMFIYFNMLMCDGSNQRPFIATTEVVSIFLICMQSVFMVDTSSKRWWNFRDQSWITSTKFFIMCPGM